MITRSGTHSINRSVLAFHLHVPLIIITVILVSLVRQTMECCRFIMRAFLFEAFFFHLFLFSFNFILFELHKFFFHPILLSVMVFCGFASYSVIERIQGYFIFLVISNKTNMLFTYFTRAIFINNSFYLSIEFHSLSCYTFFPSTSAHCTHQFALSLTII